MSKSGHEWKKLILQLVEKQTNIPKESSQETILRNFINIWLPLKIKSSKGGAPRLDTPYLIANILKAHFVEATGKQNYSLVGRVLVRIFPEYMEKLLNPTSATET